MNYPLKVWLSQILLVTLHSETLKEMDPVLKALEHYRVTATPDQKAADLSQLEKECLSTVDAYQYVYAITIQSSGHSNHQELINYKMNPDYDLDFSLSKKSHVNIYCICV